MAAVEKGDGVMKAKDFLWQLKDVNHLIDTYDEEYKRLIDKATSTSSKMSDVVIRAGNKSSKQEVVCVDLVELAENVDKAKRKLADIEGKALKVIGQIKPLKLQTVLIKYYIQNKTFEQTAVEMDITYRWVCELHGQALNAFDVITGGDIK